MPIVHMLTGLPGSGKSTLAQALVDAGRGTVRRVNLDAIRAMADASDVAKHWTKEFEKTALKIQEQAILTLIEDGYDVIVDNCHVTKRGPGRIKTLLAHRNDVIFVVHDLSTDTTAEECVARDSLRTNPVGPDVINRLEKSRRGWRLTEEWMNDTPQIIPYIPDYTQPDAVIVDIDGTLALHAYRGPYETWKCATDEVNAPVLDTVCSLDEAGIHILAMTGREEKYKQETLDWLDRNGVPWRELHMREEGDQRSDNIIKAELFERVRKQYNILFALDDRDRVVRLWRAMNIPCFQVAPGNF